MKGLKQLFAGVLLATIGYSASAADVNVDAFSKRDSFETIKISPNGEYYAATVPLEDRVALVVMSRTDKKLLGTFQLGRDTAIDSFNWVSPGRLIIGVAQKFGELDEPLPTGDLYGMDADGGKTDLLVGQHVSADLGTRMGKKVESVAAFLVDDLPSDDKNVLVMAMPFGGDPYTRLERMNVYTGQRQIVARVPVRNARFTTDNRGVARFAAGGDTDNVQKMYYRADEKSDWVLLNDEAVTHRREGALGFSADDATAYLQTDQADGPDAVVAYDVATGKRTELLRDKEMDPGQILFKPGTSIPVGVSYIDGKPRMAFFNEASPEARFYRSLQAAFGDNAANVTSSTSDGRINLVEAWGDRNPGDFYLFDTVAKKAEYVISKADWFDPAKMATQRAIALPARDGLVLKGYLTVPNGASGKNMPLIVMPHGGPFNVSDNWGFDTQAQMLAAAGYAVLQVNFRGSDNRGRKFEQIGARQLGLSMQDDVTDATKWAIQQGIADPQRICLFGASYGAFASLMGVAKEPSLYKCAAGYVGAYDLPRWRNEDVEKHGSAATYTTEWIGDDVKTLAANSPTRKASSIKVPVLLVAGREDEIAPVEHTQQMEQALKSAGVAVETHYYSGEGHGFYKPENIKDFNTKLLAFLSRNLGGGVAVSKTPAAAK
ncbi:alpha/beta hydrolase family protein [Pseudoxanthomonas sacheonensis]|uniref:Dipeptidyl aminopeptidase/acylaminoacyl peptidase n=1 Tax=Pseudoxanthomonas sacheonensis TaxID=443615 RepID=A0ABU1RPH9_9GAMM|nr:prolyl oligopeptidase family serine peptidase [Pseudoxanthomonas sacheonensis]MDR6840019.1 dipeptidyl aminopeptidase/acylaminoacyl peptidase [Pseudoxanthomonas sacheonensis]